MMRVTTEPIHRHWTQGVFGSDGDATPTAAEVNGRLARFDVADIEPKIVPYLAASAAELALMAEIPWRFSADDPPVALLRIIAKATIRRPDAGGPHTARLFDQIG